MMIVGKKVFLRAIEESDLPLLHTWANDREIWSQLGGWKFPTNFKSQKRWFAGLSADQSNHRWVIELLDENLVIGTANLVNIDWKNRHASHGILIGDQNLRGKRYGTDTVLAVMRYAFDELNFERLDSDIIEYNAASLRLYLGSCGWKEEGRQRRWHYRGGRYWDRILIGVTRDDYRELVNANGYWS